MFSPSNSERAQEVVNLLKRLSDVPNARNYLTGIAAKSDLLLATIFVKKLSKEGLLMGIQEDELAEWLSNGGAKKILNS